MWGYSVTSDKPDAFGRVRVYLFVIRFNARATHFLLSLMSCLVSVSQTFTVTFHLLFRLLPILLFYTSEFLLLSIQLHLMGMKVKKHFAKASN